MNKLKTTGTLFAIILLASCAKINELSDYNEVSRFDIISHTPLAMEVGNAEIKEGTIYININFGEYLFPLHFYAQPIFDDEIDGVFGIDFSKKQTLETPDSELVFYVMALSGLARQYTIKTRVAELDKDIALSRFFTIKEKDLDLLISEEGLIVSLWEQGVRKDTLHIFTVAGQFPTTITPQFNIAATSQFGELIRPDGSTLPFDNGNTSLSFQNADATYQLRVISESGLDNIWNIAMHHTPIVSGSGETHHRSDIAPHTFTTTQQGIAVHQVVVDNLTDNILLSLRKTEEESILQMRVQFPTLHNVQVIGLDMSEEIIFEDWDDVKVFYLLDVESRISRRWTIELNQWLMSYNEVLSFDFTYTASTVTYWTTPITSAPAITLNPAQTIIDPITGDIYLYMSNVHNVHEDILDDNWSLILENVQITVSENATHTLSELVWKGNNSWQEPIAFTVIAQDGTEKIWRVNIRDMSNHEPSSENELIGLTIVSHFPNHAEFDPDEPVIVNPHNRTVALNLIEDFNAYPLTVTVRYDISPFAQITAQSPLHFENDQSTQTITITAEDGTTSSVWTISLNTPPRSALADVETFNITTPFVQFSESVIDNNQIRIWLNALPAFPLNVGYVMTVSDRAVSSIQLSETLTFNSLREVKSFTVRAEDGSTNDWNIRLAFEPQLTNWNLDQWTGGNILSPWQATGWATANNIFTRGTARVPGNPSTGFAAQMTTSVTNILGQTMLASGSLFLGRFQFDISAGMTDPNSLTFFGIPKVTTGKILGIEFDAIYRPGSEFIDGTDRELGSVTLELVRPKQGYENATFIYHGTIPDGTPHRNNTAESVAQSRAVLGNSPGRAWDGTNITVVSDTDWTRVRLYFNFPDGQKPDFTHLHIVFSSSAQGDSFRGVGGSTLRIDNVRIIYE